MDLLLDLVHVARVGVLGTAVDLPVLVPKVLASRYNRTVQGLSLKIVRVGLT